MFSVNTEIDMVAVYVCLLRKIYLVSMLVD